MQQFNGERSNKELYELSGKINEDVCSLLGQAVNVKELVTTGSTSINFSKASKSTQMQLTNLDRKLEIAGKRQFATNGTIVVDSFNYLIDNVRREYGSTEVATCAMDKYFPEKQVNAQTIQNATYEANKGMIDPRPLSTPFKQKKKLNLTSTVFNPMYFGNIISFDEQELLYLRDFGSQDVSSRGIQQALIYNELQLMVSLYQRKFDIMNQAVTVGQYQYVTDEISYQTMWGINGANQQFVPLGAKWAINSGGNYVMNPLANPLNDMWYALTSYAPWKRYYQAIIKSGEFIMNPTTMQWILTNPNTLSQGAFQVAMSNGFDRYDLEAYFRCYFPASNIKVTVDYTMRVNEDNTSTYVYPDGYISVMFDSTSHGGSIGDFVYTTNVQQNGWQNPSTGIYTFVADLTSPNSLGGAQGNPHINIGVGANMSARIPNPNLVLSMYVI